jgi:methylmalonyl-CoA mutase
MGPKSHDHDAKLLASFFAETGFDVDISPLHQTPRDTARMAIENDVHVICFLSTENKHKSLIIGMAKALKAEHADNVRIVMGGAIPRSDYKFLYGAGVGLILGSLPADKAVINLILDLFRIW